MLDARRPFADSEGHRLFCDRERNTLTIWQRDQLRNARRDHDHAVRCRGMNSALAAFFTTPFVFDSSAAPAVCTTRMPGYSCQVCRPGTPWTQSSVVLPLACWPVFGQALYAVDPTPCGASAGAFCRHIARHHHQLDTELQDVKAALIDARLELEEAEGEAGVAGDGQRHAAEASERRVLARASRHASSGSVHSTRTRTESPTPGARRP
jgi:hypothetical protein